MRHKKNKGYYSGTREKSSDSCEQETKTSRVGGSPGVQVGDDVNNDCNLQISDLLRQSNDLLYNNDSVSCDIDQDPDISGTVFEHRRPGKLSNSGVSGDKMATGGNMQDPSNADIMAMLRTMNNAMNERMEKIEKKLERLDSVEKKVDNFEKELKSLWSFIRDNEKRLCDRLNRVEDRLDSTDLASGLLSDKMTEMQRISDKAKHDINYMQSQSMRNNLVFSGIPEDTGETGEVTERKLREFLVEKLRLAQEAVDELRFERVHRMGRGNNGRGGRQIVAKFCFYKDRETVRKESRNLKGTNFFVSEQFPRDIVEKRKLLMPKIFEARRSGKRAYISYDTLYVDGRPMRDRSI